MPENGKRLRNEQPGNKQWSSLNRYTENNMWQHSLFPLLCVSTPRCLTVTYISTLTTGISATDAPSLLRRWRVPEERSHIKKPAILAGEHVMFLRKIKARYRTSVPTYIILYAICHSGYYCLSFSGISYYPCAVVTWQHHKVNQYGYTGSGPVTQMCIISTRWYGFSAQKKACTTPDPL